MTIGLLPLTRSENTGQIPIITAPEDVCPLDRIRADGKRLDGIRAIVDVGDTGSTPPVPRVTARDVWKSQRYPIRPSQYLTPYGKKPYRDNSS